jgi:hypothetical protein
VDTRPVDRGAISCTKVTTGDDVQSVVGLNPRLLWVGVNPDAVAIAAQESG